MNYLFKVVGAIAAMLAIGGAVIVATRSSSSSLNDQQRALVDAVDANDHADQPSVAAGFVGGNVLDLLSSDVAGAVDITALVDLFELAFQDEDRRLELLGSVVNAVAEGGDIHVSDLRRVFADVVAQEMAWFDERITQPFSHTAAELPASLRNAYVATHDFLRELLHDDQIAEDVRHALDDYGAHVVANAPTSGDQRALRLEAVGQVQGFFNEAQYNADIETARRDSGPGAIAAAEDADGARGQRDAINRAVWVARDLYESSAVIRDATEDHPFVDANGEIKSDLTHEDAQALEAWATSLVRENQQARNDDNNIDGGTVDVISPEHGISIVDRT